MIHTTYPHICVNMWHDSYRMPYDYGEIDGIITFQFKRYVTNVFQCNLFSI